MPRLSWLAMYHAALFMMGSLEPISGHLRTSQVFHVFGCSLGLLAAKPLQHAELSIRSC